MQYVLFVLVVCLSLSSGAIYSLVDRLTSCDATCKKVFSPTALGTYSSTCNSSLSGTVPIATVFTSQDCANLCTSTVGCAYFKTTVNTDSSNIGNAVNCILYLPTFNKTVSSGGCTYRSEINLGFYQLCSNCVTCDHTAGKCITAPVPATVALCGIDYTDSSSTTASLLETRRLSTVRVVEELGNVNMNALDSVMDTNGIFLPDGVTVDPDFCSLVDVVLSQQLNISAMSIFIDNFYSCDYCQFVSTWHNLAKLYAYRKRFKANFVLMNYTDVNCVRNARYYSIAGHFGKINYLPGGQAAFNSTFPGPGWHTTLNFFDTDRFQIQWQEISPDQYRIVAMIQQTEGSWPLGSDVASGYLGLLNGSGTGRSPLPFNAGGPGDLPLPPQDITSCPTYAQNCIGKPPRTAPCPTTFTI